MAGLGSNKEAWLECNEVAWLECNEEARVECNEEAWLESQRRGWNLPGTKKLLFPKMIQTHMGCQKPHPGTI